MRMARTSSLASIVFSLTCLQLSTSEFCLVKTLETKPVRRSYLAQVKIPKTYTCCPNLSCDPPICTKYETVMEKKWKVEMVTARVSRKKCCPGYQEDGDSCIPLCPGECVHGTCSAPHQCTCSPGYRGHRCELYGCPPDTWGVGCQEQCQCSNFGTCHPSTGECTCPPGYIGDKCQEELTTIPSTLRIITSSLRFSTFPASMTTSKTSLTSTYTTKASTITTTKVSTTITSKASATTTTIIESSTPGVNTTNLLHITTKKYQSADSVSYVERMEAKISSESLQLSEDLLIILLSSILLLLFAIAIILTVIYYRCRMKVMRNKQFSKELEGNRKVMPNDYVRKMSANKVMKVDLKDYKKECWDNFENETLQTNEDILNEFENIEHEYLPMNPVHLQRPHYQIRK